MRLFNSLLYTFVLISFFACETHKTEVNSKRNKLDCHKQLSQSELIEDFDILTNFLRELHPDLYRVQEKEVIDAKILSIQQQFSDSLSYLEFLKLVAPLLSEIGCINTQWGHSTEYIKYRNKNTPVFPIDFKILDGQFIIEKNYSTNLSIRQGDEIMEINGVAVSDYLTKNYPLLPIDGTIKSLQHKWLASFFPNHHSNFWEQVDTFKLKIINNKKEIKTIKVKALLKENINREASNDAPLSLQIIDSIAVLKIASFNTNIIERHKQDFVSFIHSSFKTIKENKINNLIIDLSGNSWGSMLNGAFLYSYLAAEKFQYVSSFSNIIKKVSNTALLTDLEVLDSLTINTLTANRVPNQLSYTDKLYLISDGWNINAGGYFCSKAYNRPNTLFIGEKTGSTSFGMNGIQKMLTLPNSGLNLFIPTVQFIANEDQINNIDGKEVDLKIPPPYIENTIQYIQQK